MLNKNADACHVQCTGPDQNAWFCTNAPRQQRRPRPRATQHKRSRMHRTFMWCYTGIQESFTDVNELLLFKASLNAFIPSAPMPFPAHEQCHRREPAGNTISGQCCGTTPFTAPHPNTSTAAPTAGPASSSSNPNAQTKTVGTSKICLWVLATDPVKGSAGAGACRVEGTQELYTLTCALEVRLWPCLSPRLGTWSSLLRHMDGPLDTNSAAAHPLIQNPPPPRPQRRGGGRGGRGQKMLNKNADALHVQCTGPDQNAWFCTNAP